MSGKRAAAAASHQHVECLLRAGKYDVAASASAHRRYIPSVGAAKVVKCEVRCNAYFKLGSVISNS